MNAERDGSRDRHLDKTPANELWAYLSIQNDGHERLIVASAGEIGLPLVALTLVDAALMRQLALSVAQTTGEPVALRRFVATNDAEHILP